jgi:deazaflavin-dependent oxidoreductase (nitroreductase family)
MYQQPRQQCPRAKAGQTLNEWNERNRQVIEEFRTNGGKWEDRPLLLLTTTGAKSGKQHTTPLMYLEEGNQLSIFASKGGDPSNPSWYYNIVANPTVTIEVGTEKFETEARVASPEERDRLYAKQVEAYPFFGDYQAKVTRRIPVVVFERKSAS